MKTNLSLRFCLVSLVLFFALFLSSIPACADGRVTGWGADSICNTFPCPADTSGLSNIVAIAAGSYQNLALKSDGTVVAWGYNADTNFPASLNNIVAIAASGGTSMALRADGHVVVWAGISSVVPSNMPPDLDDVAAISAGRNVCMALKSNGIVVAWGSEGVAWQNEGSTQTVVPPGLSNVIAISAGIGYHALALRADGTVAAWPDKSSLNCGFSYCNKDFGQVDIPPGLSGVVAVAAGAFHSLALKSDGTVVAWGSDSNTNVPPGLNDVVAISAGSGVSLALKSDGTVVEWTGPGEPYGDWGRLMVPGGLSNVVAISSGSVHNLALYSAEPIIRTQPTSRSVIAGENVLFSVAASSPTPMTFQWRFSGTNVADATNASLTITNAQASDTGGYDVVLCSSYGCVTSAVATLSFKVLNVEMMAAVTVQGEVGANTRVDWSSNLVTWTTLTNFPLPFSPFRFADWSSVGQPHRYYRVVFIP